MENIVKKFSTLTHKPVKFLTVQNDIKDDVKSLVKSLYDLTKSQESVDKSKKRSALPELIIDGFDEEQIWQQIELQNTECWDHLVWEVANCISSNTNLEFPISTSKSQSEDLQEADEGNDLSNDEHDEENSTKESGGEDLPKKMQKKSNQLTKPKGKPSIVDDKFFKLNEMEQFLLKEEKKDGKSVSHDSDEESIDYFEDIDDDDDGEDDDEGGKDVMYSDFFDNAKNQNYEKEHYDEQENEEQFSDENDEQQMEVDSKIQSKRNKKKVTFADASSDDETTDNENNEPVSKQSNDAPTDDKKSDFELRQQRLQQTINRLEAKTLNEAPWQLKGEVNALKRPQNSLLEEVVDFDLTSRPAPVITEQTTETLVDIIRRRIKDKAWDDVIKKEKPVDDQLLFRKTETLDHSKSKQSLAQVYEAEYLKQKQALSGDTPEEKEPESHTEIRNAMSKLFSQLDALSHYHYTPKPPQAEVKIISNTPAISMEEVAPVATSDAALLAPEEVKRKRKGELQSKEERTQTDKNRERRKKKKLQRKKGKVEKITEHRNTKMGQESSDKSLKTSKAFFQQLNDDATSMIKKKNKAKTIK